MKNKLNKLKSITDEICNMANDAKQTFTDAAINWADFCCVSAEYYTNSEGQEGYRVYIEEANPVNTQVQFFIMDELAIKGFENIEVCFEW